MARWQLQQAKQQFSRVVELARHEGPQLVTRNGKEAAVVVGIDEYQRLCADRPSFKEFLESAPDFDILEIERSTDRGPTADL